MSGWRSCHRQFGFNEAAGIHRRKPALSARLIGLSACRFNEAAGIHRRKLMDRVMVKDLHYGLQ